MNINELIDLYESKGGFYYQIEEGVLGFGKFILFGEGLKTAVIQETYLSEWSSGYKMRFYNKTPKKYKKYTGEF